MTINFDDHSFDKLGVSSEYAKLMIINNFPCEGDFFIRDLVIHSSKEVSYMWGAEETPWQLVAGFLTPWQLAALAALAEG
ncbi:MAG: hypothetical protein PVI90_00440 [Desulfobacteraceae bacterium]|jgi:hypothetical protein